MKISRVYGYILLVILWISVGAYIWRIAALYSINPFSAPSNKTDLLITITYPSVTEGQMQDNWLEIYFDLKADGTIAEGVNMTIANIVGYTFANNYYGSMVSNVWIGFQFAQPLKTFTWANTVDGQIQNHALTGLDGAWLVRSSGTYPINVTDGFYFLTALEIMTFYFPVSGDYSPSIIVGLTNGTFLTHTYDQIKVHVLSIAELQTQELDQINGIVAIALLAFTIIESIVVVRDLTEDKTKRSYIVVRRKRKT